MSSHLTLTPSHAGPQTHKYTQIDTDSQTLTLTHKQPPFRWLTAGYICSVTCLSLRLTKISGRVSEEDAVEELCSTEPSGGGSGRRSPNYEPVKGPGIKEHTSDTFNFRSDCEATDPHVPLAGIETGKSCFSLCVLLLYRRKAGTRPKTCEIHHCFSPTCSTLMRPTMFCFFLTILMKIWI